MSKNVIKVMIGIPPAVLERIDAEVKEGKYTNRTQLIVEAVRKYITSDEAKGLQGYSKSAQNQSDVIRSSLSKIPFPDERVKVSDG